MTATRLGRWAREPLLHFLLLGAAIFALDAYVRGRSVLAGDAAEGEIVVTAGRIETLAALFAKTWQRSPTPADLRGLVDDYVIEEALYREGLALGVDRDDTVIRRRVRQKMEFIVDDVIEAVEPTEEQLAAWFAEHAADYAEPTRCSFRQVYLNPDRRGAALGADVERLLGELRAAGEDADASEVGDGSLLAHAYELVDAGVVARTFGEPFAARLGELAVGEWAGPLESPYGRHLVRVDERQAVRARELDDVRDAVERDWTYAERRAAAGRLNEELLSRYRVTVEWPDDARPEARR